LSVFFGYAFPLALSDMLVKKSMDDLGRLSADEAQRVRRTPVRLILDNVRSMHNVGSVFRTADAFLAESIELCGYTPRPPHRDIHKTALGATETVPWISWDSAADAVKSLIADGYRVLAVEQTTGSVPLNRLSVDPDEKIALVFGNEVEGVSTDVIALCAGSIEIPQLGMKHSLNVSVSAAMVLWEICRGRF
jgi:tRNA G18 (ribose-2'-O)-methylase SpoU